MGWCLGQKKELVNAEAQHASDPHCSSSPPRLNNSHGETSSMSTVPRRGSSYVASRRLSL
jgi:hypothetical protein